MIDLRKPPQALVLAALLAAAVEPAHADQASTPEPERVRVIVEFAPPTSGNAAGAHDLQNHGAWNARIEESLEDILDDRAMATLRTYTTLRCLRLFKGIPKVVRV